MWWLILALFSALFDSLRDIASKKSLKNVTPELAAFSNTLFGLPIMGLAAFAFETPVFDNVFWIIVASHSAILALAMFLYMKSLKMTDISISIPFTALTPVFVLFAAPALIGESTTQTGAFGVLLIALGAYLLNAQKVSEGVLAPIRAIIRDKGVVLMFFVAFLWSFTAMIDRIALRHSTPLFYMAVDYVFVTFLLSLALLRKKADLIGQVKRNIKPLAAIGASFALGGIAYIYAYKLTLAAYAISVKRTSVLFSVLFGGLLFKEKNIRERLLGASFMVAGVIIILVF